MSDWFSATKATNRNYHNTNSGLWFLKLFTLDLNTFYYLGKRGDEETQILNISEKTIHARSNQTG